MLFLPFICFYSFVLGPVLKCVLIPGGLAILMLIMGPKEFMYSMNRAQQSRSPNKRVELT
nr:hypothetical protein [Pseudoalteromonas sp. A25]